jgi:glutaredoxin
VTVDVLLLTQPDCGYCEQAKDVLARVAREFPLSVQEMGLDSEYGQRVAEGGGILFPPGVLLDGQPFSYGRLSERKLRKELRRRTG